MSKELKQFYVELSNWIKSDCPNHWAFKKKYGLCTNLIYFCMYTDCSVLDELRGQFKAAELDEQYPFDSKDEYWEAHKNWNMYSNFKRLEWIAKHAN